MIPTLQPDWPVPMAVRAAFSLRSGGASAPPWDSLNLGVHVGDDPTTVLENRRRLVNALQLPREPVWLDQVHGREVLRVGLQSLPAAGERPTADAVVTMEPGVVLAVQVADCLPVLFASEDGDVLGAAHAGWRGLVAGVLESTVVAMRLEPARIIAWLGPCIGPAHFEVGAEVREAFLNAQPGAAAAFAVNPRGRWQCDLPRLARDRLAAMGVHRVFGGQWCTAADPVRFYSHRRDQRTGRMAALLWREC